MVKKELKVFYKLMRSECSYRINPIGGLKLNSVVFKTVSALYIGRKVGASG